ncbi:MAG TPA: hypothetical protein VGB99_04035 [Acidobacteriota bacterium]
MADSVTCTLHPNRPAAGVCGSCGLPVCSACVGTSRDGMLRCHACGFGQATSGVRDREPDPLSKIPKALIIAFSILVFAALLWMLL